MAPDQFDGSRHADVVSGEVVPEEDEMSSREHQQTYLHKVASARPAPSFTPADEPGTDEEATAAYPETAPEAHEDTPAGEPVPGEPVSAVLQARRPGDESVPPDADGSLLADGAGIREQWMRVQAKFVDEPRAAVTEAAEILTDVAARLETAVRDRQRILRERWDGDGQADTEMLRVMMQQYRALLERLAGL